MAPWRLPATLLWPATRFGCGDAIGRQSRCIALPAGRFAIETPELVQGCLVVRVTKLGERER